MALRAGKHGSMYFEQRILGNHRHGVREKMTESLGSDSATAQSLFGQEEASRLDVKWFTTACNESISRLVKSGRPSHVKVINFAYDLCEQTAKLPPLLYLLSNKGGSARSGDKSFDAKLVLDNIAKESKHKVKTYCSNVHRQDGQDFRFARACLLERVPIRHAFQGPRPLYKRSLKAS
jgi:hypothetical protein